ncbi:hypothetical protein BROUX41_003502 [Berkeleyomyces rouxiae]|uniref:uncharacterized protein n=1 Tax=Berkeleyomyces rouxiae TaxID=2035830 RepID=UPI003B7675EA
MASFSEHPNGIFSGHTFYVTQRVPNRKNILKTIEGNAGIIVKVEGSPAMTIVDDARPDVPWRAHSYKYILDSVSSGALQHEEKYMIQNMRPPKPIAPKKKGRIPFTDEDDKILLDRLRGRQNISGSQIYMEIEKEFPHHPWSAWRERFRKKLKPILEREGNVSRKYPRSQFHQSPQKVASNPEKKTILTTSPHVASGSATNTSRIVPPRPQSTAPVSTTTNLAQHGQTQASKKPVVTSIPQAPASIHREPSKSLEYHAPGLASPRPLSKKKFTSLPEAEDSISQPSVYTPEVQRATQLSKLVEDGEGIPNIHSNESPSILAQKVRTLSSQSKSKLWTIREEARLEEAVMEHVKNGGHWQDIEAYKKHAEKSKSKRHSWESSKRHFAELVRQKKVDMEEWFLDSQSATESQPPSPSPRPPLVPEVGPTVDNSSSAPEIHESDNDVEDERQSSRENSRSPDPQKYIGDSQWTAPKSMSEIDTEAQLLDSHMKTDPSCPIALDYKIDGQEVNFPDVFRAVMKQRLPPREVDWLTVAEHLAIDWVDGDAEDIVTQLKSYWNSSMPHCIRYLLQSEEASTEDQDDVEEKENKEDSKDGVYIDEGEEYDEEDENYEEEPDEDEERDEMKEEAQHEDALPELPKDSGAKENTNSQQDTKTGKNPTEPTVANISTSGLFCRSGTIPSSPKARPVSRQHKRPRPTNQRSSSPDMAVFESDSRNVVPVAKKHKTIAEPETQDFNIDVSPHDQIFSEFDFHSPIVVYSRYHNKNQFHEHHLSEHEQYRHLLQRSKLYRHNMFSNLLLYHQDNPGEFYRPLFPLKDLLARHPNDRLCLIGH